MATARLDTTRMSEEPELDRATEWPIEFVVLYDRHVDAVYGYCLFRLWNAADAEDATSLVFTKALEALPKFKHGRGSLRSWLFTIAHNVVVNAHRDRRSHWPIEHAFDLPATDRGPDEEALLSDQRRQLRLACLQLTVEQREVVEFRMAGLTGAEIAEASGKSLAAVKMLQVRALDRLQALLATEEERR
jgi:RNA polymerase sigma-70 factor (ECF subfamily)